MCMSQLVPDYDPLTGLKRKLTRLKEQVEAKQWTLPQSINIHLLRNTHQKAMSYIFQHKCVLANQRTE